MRTRIPQERVGVVIGQDGSIKTQIEKNTQTQLEIDSTTGEVIIENVEGSDDPSGAWTASNIIKAIGRGFNPRKAMRLLDEDLYLEIIDLSSYVGTSKKALLRIRGRIIGKDGKTRQIIEESTDTHLSVYGKTISIIGYLEELRVAREAVTMLISGMAHSPVYTYLQSQKRRLKRAKYDEWTPL